uniref:Uncharacterized protein n=1 Tax=Microcebus murinus TaxID=30608 RepID=A0A8C5UUT4_MICMU
TLSNLHKLLPNHLMELLHSYKSEEDQKKCENPEFSGLERILARHQFPKEINLTPKPSRVPSWKRKVVDNVSDGWKKCNLWKRNIGGTKDPPMSTIVVRNLIQENAPRRQSLRNQSKKLKKTPAIAKEPQRGKLQCLLSTSEPT